MKYVEFGNKRAEVIMLLHGGGLSWWNYREAARLLMDDYRVIVPVLDGHGGSDRPFTTIEDNAAELISFIDEHFGGPISFIGGLSLGGQVLLEMLAQRSDICRFALVESAAVIPARVTNALIGPSFAASYPLIRNRSFAKLQFASLHMKKDLFDDYYRDSCLIQKADLIAFMKASTNYQLRKEVALTAARIWIITGERETGEIRRSAQLIRETIPGSQLEIMPGLYHGEFSLNHPDKYADKIRGILNGDQ